jgi:serine/threonine protein kinase
LLHLFFSDSIIHSSRLVFQDEGVSLQKLLYSITMSPVSAVIEPSLLWRKLRTPKGASSLRGIMQQVVASVAVLHHQGVTHRDVKPSNILLNTEAEARILMADLSSAVSEEAINAGFYGSLGPSTAEETLQYAPPEVLLSLASDNEISYSANHPHSYDSWSVGVVFLEMILGTSDVFTVDQRTAAMITHRMKRNKGTNSKSTNDAMLLAALADYCIYVREDINETDRFHNGENEPDMSGDNGSEIATPRPESSSVASSSSCVCSSVLTGLQLHRNDCMIERDKELARTGTHRHSLTTAGGSDSLPEKSRSKKSIDRDNMRHQYLHPMAKQSRVCGLEDLRQAILRRDPLGTGISNRWALDLLSRLLKWDPAERITMIEGEVTVLLCLVWINSERL